MSLHNRVRRECAPSTTSLLVNYRPPRITRKSYRPRASDRTMVDTIQPRSLSCFRIRKRHHDHRMNLQRTKTTRASQHEMGWKAPRTLPLLPVAGEPFLLTFPFIERAYRPSGLALPPRFSRPAVASIDSRSCKSFGLGNHTDSNYVPMARTIAVRLAGFGN